MLYLKNKQNKKMVSFCWKQSNKLNYVYFRLHRVEESYC